MWGPVLSTGIGLVLRPKNISGVGLFFCFFLLLCSQSTLRSYYMNGATNSF